MRTKCPAWVRLLDIPFRFFDLGLVSWESASTSTGQFVRLVFLFGLATRCLGGSYGSPRLAAKLQTS
jgi:hypothetical protein